MHANPTLDQLRVFVSVVETGSFSAAARTLNRTQSVISYTIANLEDQLGVSLFRRAGTRRPELTPAGRSVLEDARRMMADLDLMRARVRALGEGLEPELGVAVSALVPSELVTGLLLAFRAEFPTVSLNVSVATLGGVMETMLSERASVALCGAVESQSELLAAEQIGFTSMIPLAAAHHPLAAIGRALTLSDVRNEIQLVIPDSSGLTKGRDFNVFSQRTWKVSDVATKHQFIRAGLGWGGLPAAWVREDLEAGRLVHLNLPVYTQGDYPIFAVTKIANPPGPAARWLIAEARAQFEAACTEAGK